jgi:tRNA(Ile)-lysidine synthase
VESARRIYRWHTRYRDGRLGLEKVLAMHQLEPGTYVVAVSGGVDSVVLLDKLVAQSSLKLIVAHFDHGTRVDSADDERFVAALAKRHGVAYESKREELGSDVSEEQARNRRYTFLRQVAKKHQAVLVTAHHADDVIETIAINLLRGTGWRGLAVLDNPHIIRPLLHVRKAELQAYAEEHQLQWHEDSTNASDKYLRNRLRRQLASLDEATRSQLLVLRDRQVQLKQALQVETRQQLAASPYPRYPYIMIEEKVALELLREMLVREAGHSPLTTQLQRALLAIKTAAIGTQHDIGGGVRLEFTRTNFVVKVS